MGGGMFGPVLEEWDLLLVCCVLMVLLTSMICGGAASATAGGGKGGATRMGGVRWRGNGREGKGREKAWLCLPRYAKTPLTVRAPVLNCAGMLSYSCTDHKLWGIKKKKRRYDQVLDLIP